MKRLVWALSILAVLFAGMSAYTIFELKELSAANAELYNYLKQTNQNLDQLSGATTAALSELGENLNYAKAELNESIKSVQSNVVTLEQRSGEQIQQLGGELTSLKQESSEKLEQLEEKLSVSLKTGDFSGIIEDVIKSVVSIQTDKSLGSGVFVENKYIVTNYHVINGATAAVIITHDGKQHAVSVVGYDDSQDIALLAIEESYPKLPFANSNKVSVGQRVIALGNPGGLQFTVTEGIISAADRESGGKRYIQTDVPINPGNSGGPLVDASGRIVGINTLKIKEFEGIGFAVPSNDVKHIVEQILAAQNI